GLQYHYQTMWLQNFGTASQGVNHIAGLYIKGKPSVKIPGNYCDQHRIHPFGHFYSSFAAVYKYFREFRISCCESIGRVATLIQNENTHLQTQFGELVTDRKSTRLNSSHVKISYAVFCLKKKKNPTTNCIRSKLTRNRTWPT